RAAAADVGATVAVEILQADGSPVARGIPAGGVAPCRPGDGRREIGGEVAGHAVVAATADVFAPVAVDVAGANRHVVVRIVPAELVAEDPRRDALAEARSRGRVTDPPDRRARAEVAEAIAVDV